MVPFLKSTVLSKIPGVRHGFFTRQGGVSQGVYADLNVAREKADNLEHVEENRRRISQSLEFDSQNLVTVRQVHSAEVIIVDQPFEGNLPDVDGLITTTPGLLIGVLSADCVPVLFATPTGDMVGAVHAGWRGATAGIIEVAVQQMKDLGAKDIQAALGPCIWQDDYEVSQEFYDNLKDSPSFFKPGHGVGHWQFDLPGYVIHRLKSAGVLTIDPSQANTYADPARFFSNRRKTILGEADYGCGLSGIGIHKRNH